MKFSIAIQTVFFYFSNLCAAIEEAAPEVFLQPRNFNPHPYEIGYDPNRQQIYENQLLSYASDNRGPVLFPANEEDNATPPAALIEPIKDQHPINKHPYAGVAKKKKYRLGLGRYHKEEQVNPQVYKALAAHGAKVLKIPQAKDLKDAHFDPTFANLKKDYTFSYKVVDRLTGDDFSHSQSQNSQSTNGEYRVKLPDGRVQIVSYTADKNGYKADVKYTDDVDVNKHPVHTPKLPPYKQHFYQPITYYPSSSSSDLYTPAQKAVVNQPSLHTVTPRPYYYDSSNHHHPHHHPNVELILPDDEYDEYSDSKVQANVYSSGRGEKITKFIASTLAPYTKGLGQNVAVSTLAPDLDKFNPVYIAPKYTATLQYRK